MGSYRYVLRCLRELRRLGGSPDELERLAKAWSKGFGHDWRALFNEAQKPNADNDSEVSGCRKTSG